MASSAFLNPLFLSILILLLPPNLAIANITLSSSLTAASNDDSSWLSPSGDFAFGFHNLNSTNLFLLAVWFNKIPGKTIVWQANGDNPVQSGSTVKLTATSLVLNDPQGQLIWDAKPGREVAYAAMLDTGNFVLAGNNSAHVWETFKNHTDTILPTQTMDLGSMLFSRISETNYSRGRFELLFSDGGDLQLNPIGWPGNFGYDSYYSSGTSTANSSDSGYRLVFNGSADIYILKMNGAIVPLSWDDINPDENNYYRATLDFNGVFTQYAHPRSSTNADKTGWWPVRFIPKDICTAILNQIGSGACGFNSYCTSLNGQPSCACPPGYLLMDPNNEFGGCKPSSPVGCGADDWSKDPEELFEFKEALNINWPLGDYERLERYNQTECEKSCLHDCLCAVAVYSYMRCWKKKLPLANGRSIYTEFGKTLMKVRKGAPTGFLSSGCEKKGKPDILGWILLGCSALFNIILLFLISRALWSRQNGKSKMSANDSSVFEMNLRVFTYRELEESTNGFKEELGRGSFSTVYKGSLNFGSRNLVAVKKLDKLAVDQGGEKEFKAEVSAIGKTHHKNLVQLIGFCNEGPHRILVYEFIKNGTLANLIFGLPRPNWHRRTQIALEIARGLIYLHEECNAQIIHCDIKPQNILMDACFTARISDFGLAKLLMSDQTQTHTGIRGTRGYVAPEWFKSKPGVTIKVDVYSYGIMLLEIICCRKSFSLEFGEEAAVLTDWAYDCYVEGRLDMLVENEEEAVDDIAKLQRWVMVAIWCIQEDPFKRPTMKTVMQMLEGLVEAPVPPCPSSYSKAYINEYR
ncbi:G-type lectin S-receptor-like serine/threonine-protein kinase LECRK3 [Malania oleifera]|uniref:G-type lectin S-receptor-like serine/threonine-protein kinase LECRK3 n=1 Tax=Malania oleifera TaxID=397392 RepID=UPI0025ADCCA1|nr:G-type lectin S-receptor-like serine/threonine-protein kinase LECRK3 [Malania oleifera]